MMHSRTHNPAGNARLQRLASINMFAGQDEATLRSTLADLKAELEQVNRMIRVLEWANARPNTGKA